MSQKYMKIPRECHNREAQTSRGTKERWTNNDKTAAIYEMTDAKKKKKKKKKKKIPQQRKLLLKGKLPGGLNQINSRKTSPLSPDAVPIQSERKQKAERAAIQW